MIHYIWLAEWLIYTEKWSQKYNRGHLESQKKSRFIGCTGFLSVLYRKTIIFSYFSSGITPFRW